MRDIIVHARPFAIGAAGVLPFVVAVATMAMQPWTAGRRMVFALSIYSGILLVLLWSWIVGIALNQQVPPQHRPSTLAFRLAVLYVAIYSGVFVTTVTGLSAAAILIAHPLAFTTLHLLAVAASTIVLHFVGSNLALAEGEPATGSSWATTLSLFSIGGILPVQRRVNRIFSKD